VKPKPEIAPRVFSEPQQRAINDALRALPQGVEGLSYTRTMSAGESTIQLSVSQTSATYHVSVETTWPTQWWVVSKTARLLTLGVTNPSNAGDRLTVRLWD